jgi:hypothetical protein
MLHVRYQECLATILHQRDTVSVEHPNRFNLMLVLLLICDPTNSKLDLARTLFRVESSRLGFNANDRHFGGPSTLCKAPFNLTEGIICSFRQLLIAQFRCRYRCQYHCTKTRIIMHSPATLSLPLLFASCNIVYLSSCVPVPSCSRGLVGPSISLARPR